MRSRRRRREAPTAAGMQPRTPQDAAGQLQPFVGQRGSASDSKASDRTGRRALMLIALGAPARPGACEGCRLACPASRENAEWHLAPLVRCC